MLFDLSKWAFFKFKFKTKKNYFLSRNSGNYVLRLFQLFKKLAEIIVKTFFGYVLLFLPLYS